jgi:hypothetical protein
VDRIIYVIQAFSRGADGSLIWDAPAWSRDRAFAASLTRALSRSKAGVMTIGASFDASGAVAAEGEVLASHGCVPTSLVFPNTVTRSAEASDETLLRTA